MKKYRIFSRAGVDMGCYEGECEAQALVSMYRDAGYDENVVWANGAYLEFDCDASRELLGDIGAWAISEEPLCFLREHIEFAAEK